MQCKLKFRILDWITLKYRTYGHKNVDQQVMDSLPIGKVIGSDVRSELGTGYIRLIYRTDKDHP